MRPAIAGLLALALGCEAEESEPTCIEVAQQIADDTPGFMDSCRQREGVRACELREGIDREECLERIELLCADAYLREYAWIDLGTPFGAALFILGEQAPGIFGEDRERYRDDFERCLEDS